MSDPSESIVLKAVMTALERHPAVSKVWRVNSGVAKLKGFRVKFGFVGCPDIHGYLKNGRAIYCEVKTYSGAASKEQKEFIETAKQSGCVAFIARSADDVIQELLRAGE